MPDSQPTPAAQFDALLSRFPPDIIALVKRCLPKLRRAFPVSHELVYDYAKSLVLSFGMSERGYEAITSLAISADAVRLYFDKSLPDPEGVLEGSGTKVRSVVINPASDLDRGAIKVLIEAAIKHSGVAFPNTRSAQMVIKSKSKKPSTAKRAAK